MMMMTVGFVSSTDDDDTRRRRTRMENTQTALNVEGSPPPHFSFLGFYKTLNFRPKFLAFVFVWEKTRPFLSSHFVYRSGRKVRDDSLFLSHESSAAFSRALEPRWFSRRSLCDRAREGGCAGVRRSRVGPPVVFSVLFAVVLGLSLSLFLSLDEGKRKRLGGEMMSRTARGRAHATVETRERGRRRVDECVGNDENRSSSVFARRREEKKARRATRDDASPSLCWGFLLEGLSFFRVVNVCFTSRILTSLASRSLFFSHKTERLFSKHGPHAQ